MLSFISLLVVLVGLFFLVSISLWLWFMIYRPSEWARFIEEKRDIWAKRGESVGWAEAVKNNEEGRGLKIAVVSPWEKITPDLNSFDFHRWPLTK
jgi:hypothetical protein